LNLSWQKYCKEDGYEVSGTPVTGDQGADLIIKKSGRTIAVQAKGYKGAVGNTAVQEIAGALRFYGADEGWVVTNSAFTASARELAHANGIQLIDGAELRRRFLESRTAVPPPPKKVSQTAQETGDNWGYL
jgi:restriction system protein